MCHIFALHMHASRVQRYTFHGKPASANKNREHSARVRSVTVRSQSGHDLDQIIDIGEQHQPDQDNKAQTERVFLKLFR